MNDIKNHDNCQESSFCPNLICGGPQVILMYSFLRIRRESNLKNTDFHQNLIKIESFAMYCDTIIIPLMFGISILLYFSHQISVWPQKRKEGSWPYPCSLDLTLSATGPHHRCLAEEVLMVE